MLLRHLKFLSVGSATVRKVKMGESGEMKLWNCL